MTTKSASDTAADTRASATTKRNKRRIRQEEWAPYVFLAPTLLFFVIFFLLPMGFSLYLTFTRWNPLSTPEFIGLDNYTYSF